MLKKLAEKKAVIDAFLATLFLPEKEEIKSGFNEVLRYSFLAGGKRLRPSLCLLVYEMYEEDSEKVLDFAAALEMIHTYSLIHDDLPAMDDDDYRRGQLTCHRRYDEATAILAGDGLLTRAFYQMTQSMYAGLPAENVLKAIEKVATLAGLEGMIIGQVADMQASSQDGTLAELLFIHQNKTAALIQASVLAGAILAGAPAKEQKLLQEYALDIGVAFQISDDILDVEGDSKTLGKEVGSDLLQDKLTYSSLLGVDQAKKMLQEKTENAKEKVDSLGPKAHWLAEIACYIGARKS